MALEIRSRLPLPSLARGRWLQIGACAVLAVAWYRGGETPPGVLSEGVVGGDHAAGDPQADTERAVETPRVPPPGRFGPVAGVVGAGAFP